MSNSRGPETLRDLVATLGPNAHAATAADSARFGDVVLVAIPLKDYTTLPVDELRGKVVIDAMNYYPNSHYPQIDSGALASSEMVAAHLPGARVVKAFNTIWFEHLKTQGKKDAPIDERRVIFVSGDDAEAKRVVSKLIEEIGFGPYDLGSLHGSRDQQPDTPVYNKDITVAEARKLAPR